MIGNAGRCVGCNVPLVSQCQWKTIPLAERSRLVAAKAAARHNARGLCRRCYDSVSGSDELVDFERRTVPIEDVLDAWNLTDSRFSKYERIRDLAPRMGMTVKGLEKALLREGIVA